MHGRNVRLAFAQKWRWERRPPVTAVAVFDRHRLVDVNVHYITYVKIHTSRAGTGPRSVHLSRGELTRPSTYVPGTIPALSA